jgi:hypothetical protein
VSKEVLSVIFYHVSDPMLATKAELDAKVVIFKQNSDENEVFFD